MDSKDALIEVCKLNKASYLWFDNCFFNLKKDFSKPSFFISTGVRGTIDVPSSLIKSDENLLSITKFTSISLLDLCNAFTKPKALMQSPRADKRKIQIDLESFFIRI